MLLPLPVFVLGSILGRGGRFFLVAAFCRAFGPVFETRLLRYIDAIGWSMLGLIALALGLWFLL